MTYQENECWSKSGSRRAWEIDGRDKVRDFVACRANRRTWMIAQPVLHVFVLAFHSDRSRHLCWRIDGRRPEKHSRLILIDIPHCDYEGRKNRTREWRRIDVGLKEGCHGGGFIRLEWGWLRLEWWRIRAEWGLDQSQVNLLSTAARE